MKLEIEFMQVQIYIELGDFSQSMIYITKILATLEQSKGDQGSLMMKAQLLLV